MTALPLPHLAAGEGVLRTLRGPLRISGSDIDLAAVDDLLSRAFGFGVIRTADDRDVVLVDEPVGALAPLGADPRPDGRAGAAEAYRIRAKEDHLVISGEGPEAFFRGLVTIAAASAEGRLPALIVNDHPRFAWRGLSLDVVRRWFPVEEVQRIIDVLALHKFNVLHLHLTDSQAWRFAVPGYEALTVDSSHYTSADLDRMVSYARERHVTLIPELDLPGHVAATVGESSGVSVTTGPHPYIRYLEWEADGVADLVRAALAELAARFDAPYLHIGGDEAFGDPADSYAAFVRAAAEEVRALGRRAIGWQETSRADALTPNDLVQLWVAPRDRFDPTKAASQIPAEHHDLIPLLAEVFVESADDAARAGAAGVPAIVSCSDPLYLDRRPFEASVDPAQDALFERVGFRAYEPTPSTDVLRWDPCVQAELRDAGVVVAGVEAALWCETVAQFDDVALLLLPRLALVAQQAWGSPDADSAAVVEAARTQTAAWTRLGFGGFHRSSEVFA